MKEKFYTQNIDFLNRTPQNLTGLFAAGPVFSVSWCANEYWPVVLVSNNVEQLTGYQPEEMTSRNFNYLTVIHQDDIEQYLKNITDLLTNRKSVSEQQYRLRKKSGEYSMFHECSVINKSDNDQVFISGYLINLDVLNDYSVKKEKISLYPSENPLIKKDISNDISDVVFTCDMNLNTLYISPSIQKLTGDTPEENMRKRPEEKHTLQSLLLIKRTVEEELKKDRLPDSDKNRSRVVETQYYRKDGSVIDISSNITFLRDANGNPVGFQGIIRDITERKKHEKFILESEQRIKRQRTAFAELLKNLLLTSVSLHDSYTFITKLLADTLEVDGAGIWFLADNNAQLKCVQFFDRLKGSYHSGQKLNTEEFPNYFKYILEESNLNAEDAIFDTRTEELNEIYLKSAGVQSLLDACIVINGKLFGILGCEHKTSKRKWHNDEESFLSTVAAILSQLILIDQKKNTDSELYQSRENLNIILNSIGDGIITTDTKLNITLINPIAETLTGWHSEDAIGLNLEEVFMIVHSKTGEKLSNPAREALETCTICDLKNNATLISKNGEKFHISDSASPIRDNDNEIIGTILVFRDITKEYKSSQILLESERKYRELYQSLRDSCVTFSQEGKITECNESFRQLLGYEEDELCHLTNSDITPEKWYEFENNVIEKQVLKQGYSDVYEKEYIRKDGTVFPIELITYLTKDVNGKPTGFWAFVRDISERKHNAEIINFNYYRSQVLLQIGQMTDVSLKEITNFALEKAVELTHSKIGYLAFLNEDETILTMHAWSENAMNECAISDKPLEYIVSETGLWGEAVRQRKAIITNDYSAPNPWIKGNPEGHVQIIRHMNAPVFEKGKIVLVAGVGNKDTDYTENDVQQLTLLMQGMWRIIEKNRWENELRIFKESLENSTDAIGMSTPEGKHYFQNKAFTDLFGNIGDYPPDCLYVDKKTGEEVFKTILSGESWTGEVQMYSRDKSIIDVFLRAYANRDFSGNITAVVGIHTDITEKKLTERAMMAAKEKAEESDRLKSVFLANVSHEIRTPMNAILGFLELLKGEDLSHEKMNSYIDIVNQSGKRLLNTINDIIEISKIEAGQAEVHITEVNIPEIMQFHFDFFRQQCFDKGIFLNIKEQISREKGLIKTDRHKLDGILTNLINNAIKFTNTGSIEFGNRIEGDMLLFYVRDTGIGIPPDRIQAIFERFVQADVKKSRSHEGSGLGLAIVKAYIEMMGGKIWIESETNAGSTFYFTIPYETVKTPIPYSFSHETISYPETPYVKLLIAEDNDYNFRYLEKILIDEGFDFIRAKTGEETIRIFKENPDITMILIDIKMPGMNGLDATRHIRTFNKSIPIIAQTAYVWSGERENSLEAGCNDYILKPINRQHLLRIINKYTMNF